MRIACIYLERKPSAIPIESIAEACYRFTPLISVREKEAIFLDITRSKNLFTEQGLSLRVKALGNKFNTKTHVGFGENPSLALIAAKFKSHDLKKIPLEALLYFENSFTFSEEFYSKLQKWQRIFHLLGISTISQFVALPISEITNRFGKDALLIHHRIRNQYLPAWPGLRIPEKIKESIHIEPCTNLEPLLFILRGLIDRCMARLRGRHLRASKIELKFELENWTTLKSKEVRFSLDLPFSQSSVTGLLPILKDFLYFELQRKPIHSPICVVHFEVTETVFGSSPQQNFFNKKEEEKENWNLLLSRLFQKLNPDQIFTAECVQRYLPEKSWKKQSPTYKNNSKTLELPIRPTRLLKNPIPISSLEKLENSQWEGPERISSEWWQEFFDRDYFQVKTPSGERLWIFYNRLNQEYYLHGYFD